MSLRTVLSMKNHGSMKIDLFTPHRNLPFPSDIPQAISEMPPFLWRISPSASASPSPADPLLGRWSNRYGSNLSCPASSNSCWLCLCQFICNTVLKLFKPCWPGAGEPDGCRVCLGVAGFPHPSPPVCRLKCSKSCQKNTTVPFFWR